MEGKREAVGKRDIEVEVLRIIGCLLVIGSHVKLETTANGITDASRIIISAVLTNAVNVFWMIQGFFLFNDQISYPERIRKALKRVVLPLFLYNAFTFYFSDFIFNGQSLLDSISHPVDDYLYVLQNGILKWRDAFPYGGHLWFMYIYFGVIVISPMLQGMGKIILSTSKSRIVGMVVLYAMLIINDITGNELLQLSYFTTGAVVGASFYVLTGGVLYYYRNQINRSVKYGVLGFGLFAVACLSQAMIRYHYMSDDAILVWYKSFGIPSVIGICLMVFGFGGYLKWKDPARKIMIHLGKLSVYIYFLHAFVVYFYRDGKVFETLENQLAKSWCGDFLYTLLAIALVAVTTVVLSEAVYWMHQLLKKSAKALKH